MAWITKLLVSVLVTFRCLIGWLRRGGRGRAGEGTSSVVSKNESWFNFFLSFFFNVPAEGGAKTRKLIKRN